MLPYLARRGLLTAVAPWGAYPRRLPRKATGFWAFTVMTRVAVAVAVAGVVAGLVRLRPAQHTVFQPPHSTPRSTTPHSLTVEVQQAAPGSLEAFPTASQ